MAPRKSWLKIDPKTDFSLANVPFGIISSKSNPKPRVATAIGDHVFDLAAFSQAGGFADVEIDKHSEVFEQATLNAFAALGRPFHRLVREYVQSIFAEDASEEMAYLKNNFDLQHETIMSMSDVQMHLPMFIGDYTDFFAGKNHAFNAGTIFRGPQNALQPNYLHLPVAYHGRASSVVVSGTPIRRPWGQRLIDPKAEQKIPEFVPCKVLDLELELGMLVCKGNEMGSPIDITSAHEHIFGYVLMNDWSARDIQAWEYVPLGPFNAKNFGTTISPWVVLADALEPYMSSGLQNDTQLQSYLQEKKEKNCLDIELEADLTTTSGNTGTIVKTNARNLIWSFPQMIAHHTITGCPLRTGDLLGSGTISGTEDGALGSILELTQGGKQTFKGPDGEDRKYLQDGETVTIRGRAGKEGEYVGFGTCSGQIQPALKR